MHDHGIDTEAEYPYNARTNKCLKNDGAFRISGYTDVPKGNCD